ncbi:MAG: hypothetical protein QM489_01885 [Candidatus Izemoplasma sp.]
MIKKYIVLIEATDNEGAFFQNFFPFALSSKEAVKAVETYLKAKTYINLIIDSVKECNNIEEIDGLIKDDNFVGLIQNIKFSFDKIKDSKKG